MTEVGDGMVGWKPSKPRCSGREPGRIIVGVGAELLGGVSWESSTSCKETPFSLHTILTTPSPHCVCSNLRLYAVVWIIREGVGAAWRRGVHVYRLLFFHLHLWWGLHSHVHSHWVRSRVLNKKGQWDEFTWLIEETPGLQHIKRGSWYLSHKQNKNCWSYKWNKIPFKYINWKKM